MAAADAKFEYFIKVGIIAARVITTIGWVLGGNKRSCRGYPDCLMSLLKSPLVQLLTAYQALVRGD